VSDAFAHRLPIDRVRDGERIDIAAGEDERRGIAERLGLPSLDRLEAHATLTRDGAAIRAEGRVAAALVQSCVVTGDPVAAHIDEPFAVAFLPEPMSGSHDEEIELGDKDCDVMFHDGATIDLGAAVIDTLALALDPYPRSAGAEAALKEAGVLSEELAGPFAALAKLRGGSDNR
jgi:uncharacterized metal-binding protein YceD (DUF177 family)